jgi:hypothetical protein
MANKRNDRIRHEQPHALKTDHQLKTGSQAETKAEPIQVKGKYNTALVYAKALESNCENKIRQYMDHPFFAGTTVRIMPDVHLGKSTVIGWTATYSDLVIPSVIGLDIGCGVCACNLGRGNLRFDKLDAFIRKNIPSGQSVRSSLHESFAEMKVFVSQSSGVPELSDAGDFKMKSASSAKNRNITRSGYLPPSERLAAGTTLLRLMSMRSITAGSSYIPVQGCLAHGPPNITRYSRCGRWRRTAPSSTLRTHTLTITLPMPVMFSITPV